MTTPLGGGEFVQDNKGPANRIEPHTMPRPHSSAAEAPVVRHLKFGTRLHSFDAFLDRPVSRVEVISFVDHLPCNLQVFYTRLNANEHSVPPPASSRYIVKDTGDCSPRFMRATLNNVPATADLCRMGAMPVALLISPLALPDPQDDPIQVLHYLQDIAGQCITQEQERLWKVHVAYLRCNCKTDCCCSSAKESMNCYDCGKHSSTGWLLCTGD